MRRRTFGAGPDLAFVMGWSNRLHGENERWFVDRLVEAGFRVHAFEVPTDAADFEAAYVAPLRAHLDDDFAAIVGHSLGGLAVAHVDAAVPRVYLAPWWGIFAEKLRGWQKLVFPRLPTSRRVIPVDSTHEEVGKLVTEAAREAAPDYVSPPFVREILRGQRTLPPAREEVAVFCSLRDTVVSLKAIGERVGRERVRLYDGGHELFSSLGRERHADEVVAALPDV
jgi:pimeloyl-ACP methyl ester carboxylesterase